MTKCWRWAVVVLVTGGVVLHHSSASEEGIGKEPAPGPAGLRPQCAPRGPLQQCKLLLATAQQAGTVLFNKLSYCIATRTSPALYR